MARVCGQGEVQSLGLLVMTKSGMTNARSRIVERQSGTILNVTVSHYFLLEVGRNGPQPYAIQ